MVLGMGIAALALASCSSGPTDVEIASWPIGTSQWTPGQGADDALLEGRLALLDGCVYVEMDDGGRTVPIFPRSLVRWNADSQTITYGGHTFRMGDSISAGGGWSKPDGMGTIPGACDTGEYGNAMFIEDEDIEP
jgi:hypothetical protein